MVRLERIRNSRTSMYVIVRTNDNPVQDVTFFVSGTIYDLLQIVLSKQINCSFGKSFIHTVKVNVGITSQADVTMESVSLVKQFRELVGKHRVFELVSAAGGRAV